MSPGEEKAAARLEKPLMVAALLTIPALVLDGSSAGTARSVALALNWTIWVVFLAEIAVMVRVAGRGWLREHPLELAIVILTPPFLPAALQAARVFRLLRLMRLLKLAALTRRLLSTEGVRDAGVLALVPCSAAGLPMPRWRRGNT